MRLAIDIPAITGHDGESTMENWDLKTEMDRLSQSIYGLAMEIEQLRNDLAKNKAPQYVPVQPFKLQDDPNRVDPLMPPYDITCS